METIIDIINANWRWLGPVAFIVTLCVLVLAVYEFYRTAKEAQGEIDDWSK